MSTEPNELQVQEPPPKTYLQVLKEATVDPRVDVEKMERLFALHERALEQERKQAFADAMSRLQGDIPQINEAGRIVVDGRTRSTYATYEDIDAVVRKLMADEGFSFTVDEKVLANGDREYSGKLLHRDGHSETKTFTVKLDTSGSKNAVQSTGSTFSYARRYLLTAHLNLVTRGQDNDGQGDPSPISANDVLNLEALITEVKADRVRFLSYMKVDKLEAIAKKDYIKAVAALEAKRK